MSRRNRKKKTQQPTIPARPAPTPAQEIENLHMLTLQAANAIRMCLQAGYLLFLAEGWFHQFKTPEERAKRFARNPINCIQCAALQALEDRSILDIAETFKDRNKVYVHNQKIRGIRDLFLHRNAVGHPTILDRFWEQQNMRDFAAEGRALYDWRAAIVWDFLRSINEVLKVNGVPPFTDRILITPDMALTLHGILNQAGAPGHEFPSPEILLEALKLRVDEYTAELEKHPDGKIRDNAQGITTELDCEQPSA